MWIILVLVRVCGCADRSKTTLLAHAKTRFSRNAVHIIDMLSVLVRIASAERILVGYA